VLEIEPDHEEARNLLPALEQARDRQEKRLAELREQFRAEPTSVDTCLSLAAALLGAEQATDALGVLRAGLARHPDDARLASELAWQLATLPDDQLRNASEAVRLARLACRGEDEQQPDSLDTLGAALAETGQFEEAAEVARRASELARQAGQRAQSLAIERRLRLYQAGRPYRSPR
jgi:tetratricopeptide (TPR) repeat protein